MNRKTFLTLMAGTTGRAALGSVRMLHELYAETDVLMPALFVGHGSLQRVRTRNLTEQNLGW